MPDPLIERWYLLDIPALSEAAGLTKIPALLQFKCDKDFYKRLLRSAFDGSSIIPPLGGTEYGPLAADKINLYDAGKADHGLAEFVKAVKDWIKQLP